MKYPREFVKKVKKEFPFDKELHEALARGSKKVGRILSDSYDACQMNPYTVLELLKKDVKKLEKFARKSVRECDLYFEWIDINAAAGGKMQEMKKGGGRWEKLAEAAK